MTISISKRTTTTARPGKVAGILALLLVSCVVCTTVFSATACARETESDAFPLPEQLEENVQFWIRAFSLYGSSHTIIHDSQHLNIIYEVVNVDSLFKGFAVSERTKERKIEAIKKEYRAILQRFHITQPSDSTGLNKREHRVYEVWRHSTDTRKYRTASYNIRSQRALRDSFIAGTKRSGRYLEEMKNIFRRTGIPEALINMAFVESMFNYKTYSRMGAAGIWQFTRYTGREYLKVNYEVDERFDPLKSTEAAAKLLKRNYEILGSWPLAITAYNHGANGMKRATQRLNTSDLGVIVEKYRSPSFGFASRNFYAEFLAAKYVSENESRFFGHIEREKPDRFTVFRLPDYVLLSTLESHLGLGKDEIVDLNPSLRSPILTNKRCIPKGYELRISWEKGGTIKELYANIPDSEKFRQQVVEQLAAGGYKVKRGDTLSGIALRARVSTQELMRLNGITDPHRIYIGQRLYIPSKTELVAKSNIAESRAGSADNSAAAAVQQGVEYEADESMMGPMVPPDLAKTVSPEQADIHAVQRAPFISLYIEKPQGTTISVLSDETMGHYADWLEVSTQQLRNLNCLAFGAQIHVGQRIDITYRNVALDEFHRRRVLFHQGIREDFFQRFRVDTVQTHVVARGENIWVLCKEIYEVPLWLAIEYNSEKNLEKLKTGDSLLFPIVTAN